MRAVAPGGPDRVRVADVALRDGLQNEPRPAPLARKLELLELLLRAGVDEIEVASFVSPRWVPQMAAAEETLEGALQLRERIHGHGAAQPVLSALVPNDRGLDRALALHSPARPVKIALFTAASEAFAKRNTNASIDETIERFASVVPRALEASMQVRLYVSCAVACPFAGPIEPGQARSVADRLLALFPAAAIERGDVELDLADTIGAATPERIEALLDAFADVQAPLTLHLHDTFGRASQCVRAALARGVRSFDAAAGGLGGCPFASTGACRAPGNIAAGELVRTIHEAGLATNVDEQALAQAEALAQTIATELRAEAQAS